MITKVTNSQDMINCLNENLNGLLTKKRKIHFVKEVNNTLGKIQNEIRGQLMQNSIVGDRTVLPWFNRNIKPSIENRTKQISRKVA